MAESFTTSLWYATTMKLATSSQMQALDQAAINTYGIPGVVLMENAGLATLQEMEHCFGPVQNKTVVLFIGPGNNGGDGLVIGRHVIQRGGHPFFVYLIPPENLSGDAAVNAAIVGRLTTSSLAITHKDDFASFHELLKTHHIQNPVHSLVDSLFGTGLKRPLSGRFAAAVNVMNTLRREYHWPVIAVDIPSGLCADTGTTLGCSVLADLSVTYGLAKPGHYHHGGSTVGKLSIKDIGIPPAAVHSAELPGSLIDENTACLVEKRPVAAHKGTCGHLLIIAGSEGKTGAAILCAKAALHSGCGLVTLAVPAQLNTIFETALPEAMTVPLPCSQLYFSDRDYETLASLAREKQAIVLGPGLGTHPETGRLVNTIYSQLEIPLVIDADALNLLSETPEIFTRAACSRILTPHPGEMSRMTKLSTSDIQANRTEAAHWLNHSSTASDHEIITILKGAGTLLCTTRGTWSINSSGNNGMATGGMGDVLAGLIGGLLSQDNSPWQSARTGVYLHGLAADLLAEKRARGYTASEVADMLPHAFASMHSTTTSSTLQP